MKSEKAIISAKDYGSNNDLETELTMKINSNGESISMDKINFTGEPISMNNNTLTRIKFQYDCSFCLRTLPSGGHRFDGFGACPRCYRLAHLFVDALRGHRANYFSNLGVRK